MSAMSSWAESMRSSSRAVWSSRRWSRRSGYLRRSGGSIAGSRNGAMVGMTPSRSTPVSGSAAPFAARDEVLRRGEQAARPFATTSSPTGVRRTLRLSRSTSCAPSTLSSSLMPAESVDWVTKQRVRGLTEVEPVGELDEVAELAQRREGVHGRRSRLVIESMTRSV